MKHLSRKPDGRFSGLPPAVVRLLMVEVLVAGVLFVAGVSLGDLLTWGGPVIAFTLAILNPTVQEFGRRQPKLLIVVDEASTDGVLNAPRLRPWPIDVERVVANELAGAREMLALKRGGTNMLMLGLSGAFSTKPTDADYKRAREAFEEQLQEYEKDLRKWLGEYAAAARATSQTFDLSMQLTNSRGGAHAEAVTVVLELPATVSVAEEPLEIALPPERPRYEPPQPRPFMGQAFGPTMDLALPSIGRLALPVASLRLPDVLPRESAWNVADRGRLERFVGEVHAERSVVVSEPLQLRIDAPGRHEIRWSVYSKSARRPVHGTIALVVGADLDRPAFGRLEGIISYPDASIVDEDGTVVHSCRVSDPPPRPSDAEVGSDLLDGIRQRHRVLKWDALGLDPASDGAQEAVVARAAPRFASKA